MLYLEKAKKIKRRHALHAIWKEKIMSRKIKKEMLEFGLLQGRLRLKSRLMV